MYGLDNVQYDHIHILRYHILCDRKKVWWSILQTFRKCVYQVSVIFLQLHYCCFWLTLRPSSLALTLHAVVWHHSTIAVVGVAQRPKSFLAYVSRPWAVCQICGHFQSLLCVTHFETSWELQGHLWRQRIQEEEEHDSAGITGFVYYLTVCNSCFSRCFCLDMYFDAIWLSWILQIEQITTQWYTK